MNRYHTDQHDCSLPEYIPLDLWHQYLQALQERNIKVTNKRKIIWIFTLSRLHRQHSDLRPIIRQSIAKQWIGFYSV